MSSTWADVLAEMPNFGCFPGPRTPLQGKLESLEADRGRTFLRFAKSFSLFGDTTHTLWPPVFARRFQRDPRERGSDCPTACLAVAEPRRCGRSTAQRTRAVNRAIGQGWGGLGLPFAPQTDLHPPKRPPAHATPQNCGGRYGRRARQDAFGDGGGGDRRRLAGPSSVREYG